MLKKQSEPIQTLIHKKASQFLERLFRVAGAGLEPATFGL